MLRTSWLLGAVCALLVILGAGQAAAATVTVTPAGAKTLTATTSMQLSVIGASTSRNYAMTTCTITATWSSASGSYPLFFSPPTVPASPLNNTRGNMTFACARCSIAGGIMCSFTCTGQINVAATNPTAGGITPLRLTGIRCTVSFPTIGCSGTLAGPAPNDGGANGQYDNGTNLLTVFAAGQSLALVSSTCSSTILPTGSAILSSGTGGNVIFLTSPATTIVAV
jgi:hypothetical protein